MSDILLFKDHLTSPFIILYLLGLLVLLSPFCFRERKGISYAFTKFFDGFVWWKTKEKIIVLATVFAVTGLFGFLFFGTLKGQNLNFLANDTISEEEEPVSIVVIDISGSMLNRMHASGVVGAASPTRYELARQAFFELLESAPPAWKIGLVVFSDEVYLSRIPVPYPERNVLCEDSLAEKLDRSNPFGEISSGTKLLEAIEFSIEVLQNDYPESEERSIVIISDMDYDERKLINVFIKTELQNIGVNLVIINSADTLQERLYLSYFGERGHVLVVSETYDLEETPIFTGAIWRDYHVINDDVGDDAISQIKGNGLDKKYSFALIGAACFMILWLILRGTIARRIP